MFVLFLFSNVSNGSDVAKQRNKQQKTQKTHISYIPEDTTRREAVLKKCAAFTANMEVFVSGSVDLGSWVRKTCPRRVQRVMFGKIPKQYGMADKVS